MEGLAWLPAQTRRWVRDAVAAASRALEEDLVAVLLVGAAASPARPDRGRDPQVLVVARTLPMDRLTRLAQHAHDAMRAGVRVRALTARELARSCDVFALEVAEWRDRHVLLAGSDPFTECTIERADLVRGLEAAARGLVRRVRNRVLADLGTDGRRDHADEALADAIERALVIAHHTLALDGEPPRDEVALLTELSNAAGAEAQPVLDMRAELRRTGRIARPTDRLAPLLAWLDKVVEHVDALEREEGGRAHEGT